MKRDEILDAVKRTITQDRNNRHGEPENSFPRIADEWNRYIERNPILKPSDVAEMLAIFKTCRFETQPDNPDNEHDRIGYYAIAAELRAAERRVPGYGAPPQVFITIGWNEDFPDGWEAGTIARKAVKGESGFEFWTLTERGWAKGEYVKDWSNRYVPQFKPAFDGDVIKNSKGEILFTAISYDDSSGNLYWFRN